MPGQTSFVIIAILTPRDGAMEMFREYERKAAAILARYGGAIEQTFIEEPSEVGKPIREVHVVRFDDAESFQRYRADPDVAALGEMRAASIAHTELLFVREGPDYMGL